MTEKEEQMLIVVNETDNKLEYRPRSECHEGGGILHRAFVVLLFNDREEILIQHRKDTKLGGNRWDGSAISHVLKGENYKKAIKRSLRHELKIDYRDRLTDYGAFIYREHYGSTSENEYCRVFVGKWNNGFVHNKDEMDEAKFVPLRDILRDLQTDPKHEKYTKWFHLSVAQLMQHPSFEKYKKL